MEAQGCRGAGAAGYQDVSALKKRVSLSLGLLVAAGWIAATGCSGGGGSGGRAVATQQVATDHVASVLMVRAWVGVIYNREIFGPPGCPPKAGPTVSHPDGSVTQSFNNADCSSADVRLNPDGSRSIRMVTEDGAEQMIQDSRRSVVTRVRDSGETVHEFADGTVVGYQTTVDMRGAPDDYLNAHVAAEGQFQPRQGARQAFRFDRNPNGGPLVDRLEARVASGSTLDVQFPVTLRPSTGTDLFTSGPYEPRLDVSRSIQGSYRAPGGSRLGFKLEGSRWTVTANSGITGSFQLQQGLEGAGTLTKDGKVVATVAWDRDGRGSVTVLSGDVWSIGPSAAALDFLSHRWRLLLPSLGPSGGVARLR
jgi:hypothetical protein